MIGTHNLKALHELVIPVKRSPQSEEPFNFVRITSVTNKNDDQINFLFLFLFYIVMISSLATSERWIRSFGGGPI